MSDTLVAQADPQQRYAGSEPRDDVVGDPRFSRGAWAGRDDDVRWVLVLDLLDGDLVVPHHMQVDRRVDLAQPLYEIIRERIVVVDQHDHVAGPAPERGLATTIAELPGEMD